MASEPLTLTFLTLPSWKTFKWGYFEGRRGPLVSTWDVHCGNRDDLVFQGFWGLLSLSWVARKAGLYLLCGLSLKSGLTLIYSTALQWSQFHVVPVTARRQNYREFFVVLGRYARHIHTLEKKAYLYLLLGLHTIYSSAGRQKGMGGGAITCFLSRLFLGRLQNETIAGVR